jgi:hypothetical protein
VTERGERLEIRRVDRLIVARPGAQLEAPVRADVAVANGPEISAAPPASRTLTVTAGAHLKPGRYPVFKTMRYAGPCRGANVPLTEEMGQLGILEVH